jgi:hypothetical protein
VTVVSSVSTRLATIGFFEAAGAVMRTRRSSAEAGCSPRTTRAVAATATKTEMRTHPFHVRSFVIPAISRAPRVTGFGALTGCRFLMPGSAGAPLDSKLQTDVLTET